MTKTSHFLRLSKLFFLLIGVGACGLSSVGYSESLCSDASCLEYSSADDIEATEDIAISYLQNTTDSSCAFHANHATQSSSFEEVLKPSLPPLETEQLLVPEGTPPELLYGNHP